MTLSSTLVNIDFVSRKTAETKIYQKIENFILSDIVNYSVSNYRKMRQDFHKMSK